MRQFIQTIPNELDEAALIDGASYPRIFSTIILPLCKPVIATLAIITFLGSWNAFIGPMIYINTPEKFPISVGFCLPSCPSPSFSPSRTFSSRAWS